MMRKLISISTVILGLMIAVVLLNPTNKVFAASIVDSGTCGDSLTWTIDSEGTLTISGTGSMNDYNFTYINNTVYNDSRPWKEYRLSIKRIIVNSGATSIGKYAFTSCTALGSVTLPSTITTRGQFAFRDSSITSINFPESLNTLPSLSG